VFYGSSVAMGQRMGIMIELLSAERIQSAKSAYTTRRAGQSRMQRLILDASPKSGDLVLARVIEIQQHKRIELPGSRMSSLFRGDEIIVAYGNRYAPDQFEAEVPATLEECHLVAGGGVASTVVSSHTDLDPPTKIQPIGLIADIDGRVLNLSESGLPVLPYQTTRPPVIGVVGTAMNAGKTTTAAYLIHGMSRAGRTVGAAKVTGTGAGKDLWLMRDAGAAAAYDFTDAGVPTTYRLPDQEIERIMTRLVDHLAHDGAEIIVLEIADGLFHHETSTLLTSPTGRRTLDAVVFAAGDAMGAACGVDWLRERKLPVRAVSGVLTASPLAIREAAEMCGLPVLDLEALSEVSIADRLLGRSRVAA